MVQVGRWDAVMARGGAIRRFYIYKSKVHLKPPVPVKMNASVENMRSYI